MAAVSLRLLLGNHSKPPVPRRGSKQGYANAILSVMGLYPACGCDRLILNDPDENVYRLWRVLTTPGGCQRVVDVLESWKGIEERELWNSLQDSVGDDAWRVARWMWCYKVAWPIGSQNFRGEFRSLHPSAVRHLGPTTVRKYLERYGADEEGRPKSPEWTRDIVIRRLRPLVGLADLGIEVSCVSATDLEPEPGCVVYFDPPYQGTDGYDMVFSRDALLATAQAWADAGSVVCISEQEPIQIPGWQHVDITHERKTRQSRSLSKSVSEWLTVSIEPYWDPKEEVLPFFV